MTLRELLRDTAKKLFTVSGESAPAEARELVSFALGRRIGFSDGGIEADDSFLNFLFLKFFFTNFKSHLSINNSKEDINAFFISPSIIPSFLDFSKAL